MTFCFATWQKARGKLRMANAGQSQPLLWKDGRCDRVDIAGLPLGLYPEATYDEVNFTLEAGDILVFHSDGLSESMNSAGDFFGTDRLREIVTANHKLNASDLADRLLKEVNEFTHHAPLSDDRTLVVLKVKPQ
jgi:sigma-B regulation protein RsbU (phosphoserine phosphatase)